MDDFEKIDISTLYDPLVTRGESLQVRSVRTKTVKRFISYVIGLCLFISVLLISISNGFLTGIIISSIVIVLIILLFIDNFFPHKPVMIVEPEGITLDGRLHNWADIEAVIYEKDVDEGYDELVFNFKNNKPFSFPLYIKHDQSLITIANYILKYHQNTRAPY